MVLTPKQKADIALMAHYLNKGHTIEEAVALIIYSTAALSRDLDLEEELSAQLSYTAR